MNKKEVILRQVKSYWFKSLRQEIDSDESKMVKDAKRYAKISRYINSAILLILLIVMVVSDILKIRIIDTSLYLLFAALLFEPILTLIMGFLFLKEDS